MGFTITFTFASTLVRLVDSCCSHEMFTLTLTFTFASTQHLSLSSCYRHANKTCVYIQSCTTIACDSFRYNGILFRAIFAYASGPLAIAVFIFRNNLVPFDPDHTTSVRCYCFITFNF
jgi:hypothetical protein